MLFFYGFSFFQYILKHKDLCGKINDDVHPLLQNCLLMILIEFPSLVLPRL